MIQKINLYQVEKKRISFAFTFHQASWILGIFFLGLSLITVYDLVKHFLIRKELKVLDSEQLAKAKKLQVIAGKVPEERTRNQIMTDIKQYENEKKEKEEIISLLSAEEHSVIDELSAYFEAVSRRTIAGIWLTSLQFQNNGDQVTLKGQALSAEYVPEFVAALSLEPKFKGKSFEIFRVILDEDKKKVDFVLQTKAT